ncbi:beta-lactamase/transpeptidase-like protein [Thozetella sp. PMI_491]|nr:beta-lactamase/transpeptidase-like protein [Thozetella sp. PMI_491]
MRWIPLSLVALAGFCSAQNCPLLGPAYPSLTNPLSSTVLQSAEAAFNATITQALVSGLLNKNISIFSIQVFSPDAEKPIYEYHYGIGRHIDSNTLYRIGSISKLVSVYSILAKLGDRYWDDPVVKYVPELAAINSSSSVYDVDWREVTLGALASQLSGIGRDYALGAILTDVPGLPPLNSSDTPTCNTGVSRACTRAGKLPANVEPIEAMHLILSRPPVASAFHTPSYSNMAFQILSYAIEKITRKSFQDTVTEALIKPLALSRTFLSTVKNDSNAAVVDGWTYDIGDENPAGGYIMSLGDLSKLGKSILGHRLLSKALTQKWMKPLTHTSSALFSVGRPWEILRTATPVSVGSNTTRLVDLYTKNGGLGSYSSLLALSPDHRMGVSIFSAGRSVGVAGSFGVLESLALGTWLTAAEEAMREQANIKLAGNYTLASGKNATGPPTYAVFAVESNQPGLALTAIVSNGTDLLALLGGLLLGSTDVRGWAYPMDLSDKGKVAFRIVFGRTGLPSPQLCASWGSIDTVQYGTLSVDLVIFHVGADGKATGVEIPALGHTLTRVS